MTTTRVLGVPDEGSRSTRAITGTVVQDVWDLLEEDPLLLGDVRLVKRLKGDRTPIQDRKLTPFLGERAGQWVVIKVVTRGQLHAELAAEAEAAARWGLAVANPVGRDDHHTWVVRRFVDGRTLAGLRGRPDFAANRETLAALVLERLAQVHATGGHHGDVKPSNVLVTPQLRVQLIDFEAANGGGANTAIRHLTPEFAAPEHFDLDTAVGQPADVFSWALTVVDMYAPGHHPYLTDGQVSVDRLRVALATHEAAPLLPDGIPRPLLVAITAALRLDPASRPTASRLLADLQLAPGELPPQTLTLAPGPSTTAVLPAAEPAPAPSNTAVWPTAQPATPAPTPSTTAVWPTFQPAPPASTGATVTPTDGADTEPPLTRNWWNLVVGATGYPGRRRQTWQVVLAYGLLGFVLAFGTAVLLFLGASILGEWLR